LCQLCIYFEPSPVGRSMSESTFSGRPCSLSLHRGLSFFLDSSTNTCSLNILSSLGIHLHVNRQSLLCFCVCVFPFFTQHATRIPCQFLSTRAERGASARAAAAATNASPSAAGRAVIAAALRKMSPARTAVRKTVVMCLSACTHASCI
jgi:hypothetical protein